MVKAKPAKGATASKKIRARRDGPSIAPHLAPAPAPEALAQRVATARYVDRASATLTCVAELLLHAVNVLHESETFAAEPITLEAHERRALHGLLDIIEGQLAEAREITSTVIDRAGTETTDQIVTKAMR